MKAIINCWLITGALFCTMLSGLKAQPCPPQGDCDTAQWQGPIGTAFKIAAPSCSLQVNMMYRICNGVVEFYEVSRELIGICEAFEKRSVFHFDFDAAAEMAVQAGLQNIWEWIVQRGFYSGSVPPCSTGWGTPRAHYYTRRCGVWVYCEYAVDESVEKWCQQGFDPPFPEFSRSRWQTTCALVQMAGLRNHMLQAGLRILHRDISPIRGSGHTCTSDQQAANLSLQPARVEVRHRSQFGSV